MWIMEWKWWAECEGTGDKELDSPLKSRLQQDMGSWSIRRRRRWYIYIYKDIKLFWIIIINFVIYIIICYYNIVFFEYNVLFFIINLIIFFH